MKYLPSFTFSKESLTDVPRLKERALSKPVNVIVGGYLSAIFLGMLLLMTPVASKAGAWTNPIDALFTATSAVCVTGLTVVDTASYFSPFGKLVILALMQLGGIGIVTFSILVMFIVGKSLSIRGAAMLDDTLGAKDFQTVTTTLKAVAVITFAIESVGALLLFGWFLSAGRTPFHALGSAVFHSVSAFCNAGFSIYSNSWEGFQKSIFPCVVLMFLIFLGGIGFVVFTDVWRVARSRIKKDAERYVLSVHTKLALIVSVILILAGAFLVFFIEDIHLSELTYGERVSAAFFTSISTRTAGFSIIPTNQFSQATQFLIIMLMAIGGSAVSSAGGMKTATVALLFLTLRAIIRRETSVRVFRRTVPLSAIQRAIAVSFAYILVLACGVFFLLLVEEKPFISILFEAVSALSTVGTTLGITPSLTTAGKIIITVMMLVGRIGPITMVVAATASSEQKESVKYPTDNVIVG